MKRFAIILILSGMFFTNTFAQYLLLDSSLTISSSTTFDSVRVVSGGTLIADDSVAVLGNMTIESGGIVTHSDRILTGLRLNVVGTLDIQMDGRIDVSGKGLCGGYNGSMFGSRGEAYNSDGTGIVSGATAIGDLHGAGGSYGGYGGGGLNVTNASYGLLEDPRHLGSGGAGGYYSAKGGNGGGRILIIAGSCVDNGAIRSNGGVGIWYNESVGGGGSGGSIKLIVGTFSGTGTIEANGGNGGGESMHEYAGSGGGGRIAVQYATMTLPTASISVYGGIIRHTGSAGTIYLKDDTETYGDLIVNNGNIVNGLYTPLRTLLTTFHSIKLQGRAQLHAVATGVTSFTVEQPVSLIDNVMLWLGSGVTMTISNASGFDVTIGSGSMIALDTGSVFNANALKINGGTVNSSIDRSFAVGTDLELSNGGVLNMLNNSVLSVGVFDTTNFKLGMVNIPVGCRLDITTNSAVIGSGVMLVKDGKFGINDSINSLTILSGGVLTHSPRLLTGLRLNVTGTIDVQAGGKIDVTGKGLRGGWNGSIFDQYGEAYNEAGTDIVQGAGTGRHGAGGSYGGWGGNGDNTANTPYGLLEDPKHLGSGGACGDMGVQGGNGGGRMLIVAGSCIVNGSILANGGVGTWYNESAGGGGSGGSIRLIVGTLSGTGTIEANGGSGGGYAWYNYAGSGGGGRIAIEYTTMTLPIANVHAYGGTMLHTGSAGTIYTKDNVELYGNLIVNNGNISNGLFTPLRTSLTTFRNINLQDRAQLHVEATEVTSFTVEQPVSLLDSATLWLGSGVTMTISNTSGFDITIGSSSMLIKDGKYGVNDSLNSLTIESGGIVTHSDRLLTGLRLNVGGTLDVQAGGMIDVSGKGLRGGTNGSIFGANGETYGSDGTTIISGAVGSGSQGAGASYGGWGANGGGGQVANAPYGYIEDPRHLGSGGGNGVNNSSGAGHGGGMVTIIAGNCIVDGTIRANGGNGGALYGATGGGGSGGSVKMTVGTLSGGGAIQALGGLSGGFGWDLYSGSGGGGRIAIYFTSNSFPESNLSVTGGTDAIPGSPGTILLADRTQDFRTKSTVDEFIVLSPAGNIPFHVTLKDQSGSPVVGSTDVWLEFIDVDGLTKCPSQIEDQIQPLAPSDSSGNVWFSVKRGGCTSDLLKVKTSQGLIAQVPIKSLDHNGGLLVTAADFVGDACNDYNNDGVTNGQDFDFFVKYLGHTCIDNVTNYIQLSLVTNPSADRIFIGDTVDVCGKIISVLDESILLDSVVFSSAQFGIAQPWAAYGRYNGTVLNPRDTLLLCEQFLTNAIIHGCWKIQVYARLFTSMKGKQFIAQQQAGQAQVNGNGNVQCRPPREPYKICPLCGYCVSGDVDADGICDDNEAPGCVNPDDRCRPLPHIGPNGCPIQNVLQPTVSMKRQTDTLQIGYSASIPIGSVSGDSLYLYRFSFMPEGWSYVVSDSGWIHTPDTVHVIIYHNPIIHCGDTGKVVFYAYDASEQFAGNATISLQSMSQVGDLDMSGSVDTSDLVEIVSYIYQWGESPFDLGSAEITGDDRIDISDVTRFIDYLYISHEPFACVRDTEYVGTEISIATSYLNDTTTIYLTSPIDLKGLQLELIGLKNVTPENLLGDSLGIAFGALDSLYRIGLFDLSGGAVIKSGARNILRIPGAITILSSRASDKDHHSLPITTSRAFDYDMRSGWNLLSIPIVSYYVKSNDLFPSATSSAFTYQNLYVEKDTLKHGIGYWLKFGANEGHVVLGFPISLDTINVLSGWNMIGSVSEPIPVGGITSIPGGRITSDFFGYTDQYRTYDTIYPGKGYWVKVNQDGQLILSSATQLLSKGRIKIVPTSEMPPSPPSDIAGRIELPKEYQLEQNYPNPFNPITTIKYGLPFSSNVKLKIFNVLGQVITTLKDEEESAGYKQIEWNSSTVASGIYFYRLEATSVTGPSKSFIQVKKLVVLK